MKAALLLALILGAVGPYGVLSYIVADGVQALDLFTFAGMSASMLAVGLLASYLPARRASNVDPIGPLRSD